MAPILFTERILKGEPIDVYNNGDMKRDFTFVDDIVEGFALATKKPMGFEIINLGNGEPVHLLTFIETLEQALGIKAEKKLLPLQPGDMKETFADTTKAKDLLGFEARVNIKDGVDQFVSWYKSYFKI
jgi:UDP-glucuronate 4-epimerase